MSCSSELREPALGNARNSRSIAISSIFYDGQYGSLRGRRGSHLRALRHLELPRVEGNDVVRIGLIKNLNGATLGKSVLVARCDRNTSIVAGYSSNDTVC